MAGLSALGNARNRALTFGEGRYRRALLIQGAAIAACGVLASACGSIAAPSAASSGQGHQHATATAAAKASLSITLTGPAADSVTKHWTLRCDPAGGTAPHATTACSQLMSEKEIFNPQPVKMMCPMIMADARTYVVIGKWFGREIHQTIADGGCQISRWVKLNQIFN